MSNKIMHHPFELELSQLKSVNLKIDNLDVEEITDETTETIAGGFSLIKHPLREQGGYPSEPVITQACFETGCGKPQKPILTRAAIGHEQGGNNISALLGESGEGPRF